MKKPVISDQALIASDVVICGDVRIERGCSIWFHTTIRAECSSVTIGADSNIQDNCVVHVDSGCDVSVGERVTVGHGVILHGCTVGDNTLIGMGSIILNGARIGRNCVIGAGSLVTQNMVIPDGSLVFGSPARVVRPLTEQEITRNGAAAQFYVEESRTYQEEGLLQARPMPE